MTPTLSQLARQVAARDAAAVRAAGRLITLLDNQPHRLGELLSDPAVRAVAGRPDRLLGLTGPPGSGKSTLVDALVGEYRGRFPERRVGVLAVDPSSPFTGGAVLGDRVRMMRHAEDAMVFVRSMASRGRLGGLSLGVRGAIHVMALLGCDPILIETVGVGQSEVEITRVADQVLVVLAPGQGDAIQLLKAGLLEIADQFIVNKADRPDAQGFYAELLSAVRLGKSTGAHRAGEARIALVSAQHQQGIAELLDQIETAADRDRPSRQQRREEDLRQEIREAIFEALRRRLLQTPELSTQIELDVRKILDGQSTLTQSVQRLLEMIPQHTNEPS